MVSIVSRAVPSFASIKLFASTSDQSMRGALKPQRGNVTFYAHSVQNQRQEKWQRLEDHLLNVAGLAAEFASPFEAGEWARMAGQWHDLGKYSNAFQSYLRSNSSPDSHLEDMAARTDHSTAGAQYAAVSVHILGHLLAYVIAGHHSGLLDGRSERACLEARLKKKVQPWGNAPESITRPPNVELPSFVQDAFAEKNAFTISLFTRMLFSCLVDADFLDTERFMAPEQAASRPRWPQDILDQMEGALNQHIDQLCPEDSNVNHVRAFVRQACLEKAKLGPGLFSLTVPTGGGKTLSSLAFALRHAVSRDLRRVIYVIPFTSIIEQNAKVFRDVMLPVHEELGIDPVLEHHCNIDEEKETITSRLATENWDAPLVVTTSVQFYESLLAKRTSRCRKLHNLINSVIILDEVQSLPVDCLSPCILLLRELTDHYGCTIVLCTATQPAVHRRKEFPIGLSGVREIMPEPNQLYQDLKRVKLVDIGRQNDRELAERLIEEKQVLCIVNTRSHARKLFEALGKNENHFHLSALMCPVHRNVVIEKIRQDLLDGRTCRVISTQLIEAGVDIDFPVVYRSFAGLDSIAQAAGRCNRNGRLAGGGYTYLFRSEHADSERFLAETANNGEEVFGLHDDPLSLEAIEHYFRLYYWQQSQRWDSKRILSEFHLNNNRELPFLFNFTTVAERFHLIQEISRPVIIPWKEQGRDLCEQLRVPWKVPDREVLRNVQRYTIQIHQRIWYEHVGRTFELIHELYPVLTSPETHYDEDVGLSLEARESVFLSV